MRKAGDADTIRSFADGGTSLESTLMAVATSRPTGTVTFLFTDIEGSTRLWERYPQAMKVALARHDVLLRQAIEAHGGYVFKTMGDAFCAAFAAASDAVAAAQAAQQAVQAEEWEEVGRLRVRMALHTGTAEEWGGDYFGPPLNRVARLLAAGHGGQILLSQATVDRVRETLPEGTSLRELGAHRLKDLQQPEPIAQLVHPDLLADFPPLRSLEAFSHNLPRQLTSFVGREREMAAVKQLLSTASLLTLTGAGGGGKTRIALQVAADLIEEYANGVWLVELAALADPLLVPQTVASALGVREEPGRSITQTLMDALRARQLLLLLDNCEHLLSACAQLADSLLRACPKLRILATSREALGIMGEQTYQVPSLSLPDPRQLPPVERLQESEAVRLFTDRAVLSQSTFALSTANARAVAQICQRLDGIPLAIELAAARVKVMPVEQIASRLDDRFRLLTGGSRTALPRQQTLRALIDWSYDLLSEPERALLRRLSVFAGGWTLEAAEAVAVGEEVEAWEVLDLLSRLVDKSLVILKEQAGEARYRLLETVRQYARDRLLESGEAEAVRARHRDWFLTLAEQAEPELPGAAQGEWLDRLESEHDNLRAALSSAVESKEAETGLRLGAALWRFWHVRGYLREGRDWLEAVLALPGAAGTLARARALNGAGSLADDQGDFQRAAPLHEESLAIARELDHEETMAYALLGLGNAAIRQERYEEAKALYELALPLGRRLSDQSLVTTLLSNLGYAAVCLGQLAEAIVLFEESLALDRKRGNQDKIAVRLNNLAWMEIGQRNFERAAALLEESLCLFQRVDNRIGISEALNNLASLACEQGYLERAACLLAKVRDLTEATGAFLPSDYEQNVAAVRARLEEAAFAAEWAAGCAMSLEQTIAFALARTRGD